MTSARLRRLRVALLAWYHRERRELPWRGARDPYRVWVSEVMLQQTTVKVVLPYYTAFLELFPTLTALAAAAEDDVLARWSGLGYYRRARQLHAGARHVVERHAGRFPATEAEARAVPGVGPYTAAAVLSIAYGVPLPVVDGNVRRVFARLFALRGPEWQGDKPYYVLGAELLARESPGDWNQALMELGATLCTPRHPACPRCPLRSHCRAQAEGMQGALPEARARRRSVDVSVAAALLERDGLVLLVQRGEGRVMRGLWEIPQTTLESAGQRDLVDELRERHGLRVALGPCLLTARHAITYRRITAEVYRARLLAQVPDNSARFAWVDPRAPDGYAMSSLTRKLLRAAGSPQRALALDGQDELP